MYKKIKPYMGEYLRFTRRSIVAITIAVILSVVPYFLLFQLISPLLAGERLTLGYVSLRVGIVALCLVGNAVLYVHGLDLSHFSAYNTLKNLRTALQGRLEQQPLGVIRELGNGRIKKVFAYWAARHGYDVQDRHEPHGDVLCRCRENEQYHHRIYQRHGGRKGI